MINLRINTPTPINRIPGLQGLMGKGILVKIKAGQTLADLLCAQLGVDPEYLQHRVQTLFLNSQPVDDADNTFLADGDKVALSAAMPGLVGATLRKGGHLAEFRKRISYRQKSAEAIHPSVGTVTIRMFNVIAKELGPSLMELGQSVESEAVQSFLKLAAPTLNAPATTFFMNGEEITLQAILNRGLSEKVVRLSIGSIEAA